jgi:hypothetical protein
VLANPPFNDSHWRGELLKGDLRWVDSTPPPGNANFAWVQHFIHHLSPTGTAGFVPANGSMSSNHSGRGEIRRAWGLFAPAPRAGADSEPDGHPQGELAGRREGRPCELP